MFPSGEGVRRAPGAAAAAITPSGAILASTLVITLTDTTAALYKTRAQSI